jgi:predicted AlkP superfamily pyrophosphatase or phosphodiesterase
MVRTRPPGQRRSRHVGSTVALALALLGCQRGVDPATDGHSNGGRAPAAEAAATPAAAATAAPRLVVMIVIDQLPSWAFERDRAHFLARKGGLGRLLTEGTHYVRATFPYAMTYTAPGHATIGTGTTPDRHGIIANNWYRSASGSEQPAELDEASPVFAVPAPGAADVTAPFIAGMRGVSGRPLRVDGVADVLRRERFGRARSVTISGKARAACLVAGRQPDLAIWFEPTILAMTTSRFYATALPAWLATLAAQHPIAPYLDKVWEPLDRAELARLTGIPDNGAGEGSEYELGIQFPYAASRSTDPPRALFATPWLDIIEVDTALAAVDGEGLGADEIPDLLAISFSAHDYAGHNWGQESWELLDLTFRLDDELGRLFDGLDRRLGADSYAVVLTSDHGGLPLVERSPASRRAVRIHPELIIATAERAAESRLGAGKWIADYSASSLYPTAAFAAAEPAAREAAIDAIIAALATIDGVGYVTRTDRVSGNCDARDGLDALVCRSLLPGSSGMIYLAPRDGSLVTDYPTGTSHEPPADEDRDVPIIVRAPGQKPGRVERQVSALQVAPTVAALLGISPPPAATEPALR